MEQVDDVSIALLCFLYRVLRMAWPVLFRIEPALRCLSYTILRQAAHRYPGAALIIDARDDGYLPDDAFAKRFPRAEGDAGGCARGRLYHEEGVHCVRGFVYKARSMRN